VLAKFCEKAVFNNEVLLGSYYASGFGQQIIILLGKTEKVLFSTMLCY
jgi:hypothetical protein